MCVIDQTYVENDIVSRRGPWSKTGQRVFGTHLGSHNIGVVSGAL